MNTLHLGHPYLPHTSSEVESMMKTIGIKEVSELFQSIPNEFKLSENPHAIETLSEQELTNHITNISNKNSNYEESSFVGGGIYNHYIPSIIKNITSRGEFFTAYTPYQPEISQGTLQAIFEYQSHICALTGMDASNASMYDGATAVTEAALLTCRHTKRNNILACGTINKNYLDVLESYTNNSHLNVTHVAVDDYRIDINDLKSKIQQGDFACLIVQTPNQFGLLEDMNEISSLAKESGTTLIYAFTEALSLALLKAPIDYGVEIVAGEGQSLGNGVNFGGPLLGIFAVQKKYMRSMPGRIVGQTKDTNDKRGFVLTLATREQHIRRERATSNICSNQGLCALSASIYLSLYGKNGLKELAEHNAKLASYAFNNIKAIKGVKTPQNASFFNEFVIELPSNAKELLHKGLKKGIVAGIPLEKIYGKNNYPNNLLLTFTETNSVETIDALTSFIAENS
ncbi:MAG: aminomethyl-transferring glycine dehydrogenase subunit GcvPA [Nitrospinae bacterium]|nr:aminomethyl-transferring glycine dehydrogenase subunit GcvPA [Nitrospinota bacterium]